MDLSHWKGVPRPDRVTLDGRYTRLEPLDPARHGPDLLASAQQPGADDRGSVKNLGKPACPWRADWSG